MPDPFHAKLDLALRALSMSHGAAASRLAVHKSMVGRWVSGAVKPSRHNLARLSDLIAERIDGFTALDWDLSLEAFTRRVAGSPDRAAQALSLPLFEEASIATERRAAAYEGVFRGTRPYAQYPGQFIHDYMMIRREGAELALILINGEVRLEGRIAILHGKLFVVAAEATLPTYGFAILNGVHHERAGRLDGLLLYCTFGLEHTPTATPFLVERIGELSGDREVDDALLKEMSSWPILASPPPDVIAHLSRDIGPRASSTGGDWVLSAPLSSSLAGGLGMAEE